MHVNVAIVGLDRISASLGLALKRYQEKPNAKHTFTIIGRDTRTSAMKDAHKAGAIDNFNRALLKATDNADLIIFNSPPGSFEEDFTRLGSTLKPGAVVLDMSPLKQPAIAWAAANFPKNQGGDPLAYVVGFTPVVNVGGLYAGSMEAEAAAADIFDEGDVIITPDASCPSEAIQLAEDVARLIGGEARFMDPQEHDGLIAATEGLPALLGVGLFHALEQSEGWTDLRRMVNPALAMATQNLRHQSVTDMVSLFTSNREHLARHLEGLIGVLDQMRDLLVDEEDVDHEKLSIFVSRVKDKWETWDVKRHSGKWEAAERPPLEAMPGPLGGLGNFLGGRRRSSDDEDDGNS